MNSESIIKGTNYRFTVLTERLIRLEYSDNGQFEDRTTQVVQNRDFKKPEFQVFKNRKNHQIEIITKFIHLYYDGGKFTPGTLYIDAAYNYGTYMSRWYFGEKIKKNLKGTARTLDKADGEIPLEDGLMAKDGFSYLNDSKSFILSEGKFQVRQNSELDYYYFAYGHDFEGTLKDYYQLTGFTPLIPRYALGNWWSRYWPYTQTEYKALFERFNKEEIPISVAVMDMDWHLVHDVPARFGSGWTGYTWNKKLFPDHKKLIQWLHDQGKHVTINDHPAAGVRAFEDAYPKVAKRLGLNADEEEPALFDFQNPLYRKTYFEDVHRPLEKDGIDFWWIDWQQGQNRSDTQVDPLWLLNHYVYQDNANQHSGNGLTLSRYGGPGSHRYPLGFSGDTVASWKSLQFQPYFTSTASNIGYTWWSHDIGGHMNGAYDSELTLRWMQFGVFSPINRLHSSENPFMGKEPWNYDENARQVMTQFLRLRSSLVPYLDTANDLTHQNGVPLVEPVYYKHPDDKEAYTVPNQYYFGSELMVAAITEPSDEVTAEAQVKVWLPEGDWYDFFTGVKYVGGTFINASRSENGYPVFVKAGGIVPLNENYMENIEQLPEKLTVRVYPGKANQYTLVEHQNGAVAKTTFEFDGVNTIKVQTNDPEAIIPTQRQIVFVPSGNVVNNDENQVQVNASKADITVSLKFEVDSQLVLNLIYTKLQHAKISFDLKKAIWNNLRKDSSLTQKVSYLNTLEQPRVAEMLLELVGAL
ncbi:glycoside hydrolase family 31 protein [Pediococcus ethanolidurans]|uniref:Alpha-glucosidase, glycosyl hydrolase family GH31 n=1 Tax=Pediococcus ethanolidurans TaxID=319653 RepID=A0A0R2KB63_9LACO|nr:TIM-barrel domain-containing protein [Pediococcus ethanolidurans]KRN83556.1 glycosyl hydrolase, family 31 [Pediococcus ethanolidurans]GEN94089.1 alpha-glucosidase [Pediococcus ethanolidurans]SER04718.1 Alpha-glucosidase, glycosyl hydrolase family GH31 [Pediococcus ethanolidurans]